MKDRVTSDLPSWSTLAEHRWPTLLIGNGFSMNIWEGFSYKRLFDKALLTQEAKDIFKALSTTNFEGVLEKLMHTQTILNALGDDASDIEKIYESVQSGLFEAVRKVHIPWAQTPDDTLSIIANVVNRHQEVFTTNYDLIPYWAQVGNLGITKIADYFGVLEILSIQIVSASGMGGHLSTISMVESIFGKMTILD